MSGEAYDYLMGLVIMGMIFVSAALVVPNLSYVNLLYVDQQQLRNVAQETLKIIIECAKLFPRWIKAPFLNLFSLFK